MKPIVVAVVGANGYVGHGLCNALEKMPQYQAVPITRANYQSRQSGHYDILINAAMPSKRFWAKSHPKEDFAETVQKTADLLYGWKFKKFVQISTVSVRCEPDSIYGRHKAAAEKLCLFGENLICRLTAMYSEGLQKGALIDILNSSKVFVSAESKYAFASLDFVCSWIAAHLDLKGLVEVGAKNVVSLGQIVQHLGEKIEFEGPVEIQDIQNPAPDFPDARDVFKFMDEQKKRAVR